MVLKDQVNRVSLSFVNCILTVCAEVYTIRECTGLICSYVVSVELWEQWCCKWDVIFIRIVIFLCRHTVREKKQPNLIHDTIVLKLTIISKRWQSILQRLYNTAHTFCIVLYCGVFWWSPKYMHTRVVYRNLNLFLVVPKHTEIREDDIKSYWTSHFLNKLKSGKPTCELLCLYVKAIISCNYDVFFGAFFLRYYILYFYFILLSFHRRRLAGESVTSSELRKSWGMSSNLQEVCGC